MKKIVKVASGVGAVAMLGVAALPLTTYGLADNVNVTIDSACGFRISESKSEGEGAGAAGDGYLGSDTKNSLMSADLAAGQAINATTQTPTRDGELFTHAQVVCNDAAGYTLSLKATATKDINLVGEATSHAITGAGGAPAAGAEKYSWYIPAYTGGQSTAAWVVPSTAGYNVASTTAPAAATGDNYYVNYGVGTENDTPADTYTASVTYTLTPKTP